MKMGKRKPIVEKKMDLSAEGLKSLRNELRKERTELAVDGGIISGVYNERITTLNLRVDAIDKALWHLDNPDK